MSDTIGRISVPAFPSSGLTFPLGTDVGAGVVRSFPVIEHRFGGRALQSSQRFLVGFGPRRFGFQRKALSAANRAALLNFYEATQGSVKSFLYAAPDVDGTSTKYSVVFDTQPLSFRELVNAASTGCTFVEVNDAKNTPDYAVSETNLRFPASALSTALLSQVQQLIPLLHIKVRDAAVADIYLSDRRCTVGGQLYLPRVLNLGEPGSDVIISQNISGQADNVQFVLGNADRVMTKVANDCDLLNAAIDLCFYHVGSGVVLQLWKGIVVSYRSDGTPQFTLQCSDGLYAVNQLYPVRVVSRTCFKLFDDGVNCPYAAQGSGGGNPLLCSYQFSSPFISGDANNPGGWTEHGMVRYFGGHSITPQGVRILDNSTGVAGFGRNRVTATSIVSDSIWGQALPEIYCNDGGDPNKALIANALVADVRDEGDFVDVLGIVGLGPIGQYSVTGDSDGLFATNADGYIHLLAPLADGFPAHGLHVADNGVSIRLNSGLGLRQVVGNDPCNTASDSFSLGQSVSSTSSIWGPEMAAGTAFVELRYGKPPGFQPSTTDQHSMTVPISKGLSGWTWDAGGTRTAVAGLTNPFWVATNSYLRAIGQLGTIPVPMVFSPLHINLPPSVWFAFSGGVSAAIYIGLFIANPMLALLAKIGQAIGGAFTGNQFSVPMSDVANQAEAFLKANLYGWQSLAPYYRTSAMRATFTANYDAVWGSYVTACNVIFQGDPNGSDAKKALNRPIGDRLSGGKFDWVAAYRTPISGSDAPGDSLSAAILRDAATQANYFVNPFVGDGTGPAEIADLQVAPVLGAGLETQFQFQGTFAQQKPFRDWLTEIMGCCLGYFVFEFGRLKFGIRENASAVNAFTVANTLYQSLVLEPISPQFEKLTIDFADAQYQYAANTAEYCDKSHAQYYGRTDAPLSSQMHVSGVSSMSQGLRIAATRTREEIGGIVPAEWSAARRATWRTTILGLSTEVGQVVSHTHTDIPGGVQNYRIKSWKLFKDWSIEIQGQAVTPSMYDLDSGPKPADVQPDRLPILYYPQPVGQAWAPYQKQALGTDALFPSEWTFDLALLYVATADGVQAQARVTGKQPVTQYLPAVAGPDITAGQVVVSSTGGTIPGGLVLRVAVCAYVPTGQLTPPSQIILVQTPPGTDTCSFTLNDIVWPALSTLTGYVLFGSDDDQRICEQKTAASLPASITFTGPLQRSTWALPNANVGFVRVKGKLLVHGGVIGCAVDAVTATTIVASEAVDAAGLDNWAGRVLIFMGRADGSPLPFCSVNVTAFDPATGTFTVDQDLTTLVSVTDAFVVSFLGSFNDQNPYAFDDQGLKNAQDLDVDGNPAPHVGLRLSSETGCIARVIKGTGRGQTAKVVDNTHTGYSFDSPLTLDDTSILIIEGPSWETQADSSAVPNADHNVSTSITLRITNYEKQSMLIAGFTVDQQGVESFESDLSPRMLYVYGGPPDPTVSVTADTTLDPMRQNVVADASGGPIMITLPPFVTWLSMQIAITKMDTTANVVSWQTSGTDNVAGYGTTGTLTAVGQTIMITAVEA